jgi:hypothetical protein
MDCIYLMGVWKRVRSAAMDVTDSALVAEYDRFFRDGHGGRAGIAVLHPGLRAGRQDGRMARGSTSVGRHVADRGMRLVLDFVAEPHRFRSRVGSATTPEYYVQGTLDNYRAEPTLYHPIEERLTSQRALHRLRARILSSAVARRRALELLQSRRRATR